MIQEFKVRNFLSFRDEIALSFEATNDNTFDDTHVVEVAPGVRLLRFGLVYGANASGKSNLIAALDFIRVFLFDKKDDIDDETETIPFLLDTDTKDSPSEFEMTFYVGTTRYVYKLSLTEKAVISESMSYYKTTQPLKLFSRRLENGRSVIEFGASVKASKAIKEEVTLKCLPNMSFFAARNQVNCSLPEIDSAMEWMKKGIMPVIGPNTQMFGYAGKKMSTDSNLKEYILRFVRKADFNISDMLTEKSEIPLSASMLNAISQDDDVPASAKKELLDRGCIERLRTDFELTVKNKRGLEKYTLPESLQSDGTKRTFGLEAAIYESINSQRMLPIDEIESSLHPELVEFMIAEFLRAPGRSQMIATTHYDPLLNTIDDLIRKDSVWFTEKEEDGNSGLYSLVEFNDLNKVRSFQRSYRNGAFGALPNIKG